MQYRINLYNPILIQKEYVKIIPVSYRFVFMGSPDFAAQILAGLATNYSIVGVFTQPDRESGRGKILTPPPVKTTASALKIPVYQPQKLKSPEAFADLAALEPDVIVVAAYGQILRQNVLDLPKVWLYQRPCLLFTQVARRCSNPGSHPGRRRVFRGVSDENGRWN